METNTYLNTKAEISTKINELSTRLKKLEQDYIQANREFADNEKVRIESDKGNDVAYVSSCKIHDDGRLYYGLRKVLKNGLQSNQRFDRTKMNWYNIHKL